MCPVGRAVDNARDLPFQSGKRLLLNQPRKFSLAAGKALLLPLLRFYAVSLKRLLQTRRQVLRLRIN